MLKRAFFYCKLIAINFLGIIKLSAQEKADVMLIGFDHLSQLSDGAPESDIFSRKKQGELAQLAKDLSVFSPDMILVEKEPSEQVELDSLYTLYKNNTLQLKDIEYGTSETYQLGFRLAKILGLEGVYGVDHYESTSQSLLSNGTNIEVFRSGLKELQQTARPLKQKVQHDSLSLYRYIRYMNTPEMIKFTHSLFFNTPAYVTNGTFSENGHNTVDLGTVDTRYIGAEYITLFYNRNLKIYTNILTVQAEKKTKKLLVIMGQVHVGVLKELFEANDNYTVVSPLSYLKK